MMGERGSITPVFIALLAVVLILVMAFVDREWANYALAEAIETADFAAEAGAAVHEVYADADVRVRQYYIVDVRVCDEENICHDEYNVRVQWYTIPLQHVRAEELVEHWRDLAGCRAAAPGEQVFAPELECYSAEVTNEVLEFTDETKALAERTFLQNWQQRANADAAIEEVHLNARDRIIRVDVDLTVRSLFGLLPWQRKHLLSGAAVVQPRRVVLK